MIIYLEEENTTLSLSITDLLVSISASSLARSAISCSSRRRSACETDLRTSGCPPPSPSSISFSNSSSCSSSSSPLGAGGWRVPESGEEAPDSSSSISSCRGVGCSSSSGLEMAKTIINVVFVGEFLNLLSVRPSRLKQSKVKSNRSLQYCTCTVL